MKNRIIILSAFLNLNVCIAQNSGKILFEEKIKLETQNFNMEGGMDSTLLALFPTEIKNLKELYFVPNFSLYKDVDKKETEFSGEEDNNRIIIHNDAPNEIIYSDLKAKKTISQRDLMGRTFLIETEVPKAKLQLTGNKKTILNYPCNEAFLFRDKDTITVWYTTELSGNIGPDGINGLPGLVLAYADKNETFYCEAISIDLKEIDDTIITEPKKGKKISEEEFYVLQKEKLNELQEQFQNQGSTVIKIGN